MTPIQGTATGAVNWQALLDKLVETSGADGTAKVSADNRTLTFTANVNGVEGRVTVNIPDDLDLPGEVDEAAITSLVGKLADPVFNLSEEQIKAFEEQITKIYKDMSTAVGETKAKSTGSVMFDLYKLMALLVEVAQSQRDAARELRTAQSAQIQTSIQSQADTQRNAALVGLIVGVVCGAISAIVSGVMLGMQGSSYKDQLSAARSSGADAAQTNLDMVKGADTAAHANAQLQKVERQVGEPIATDVKADFANKLDGANGPKARIEKAEIGLAQKESELQAAQLELNGMRNVGQKNPEAVQAAQTEVTQTRAAAGIPEGKTAAKAKFDYVSDCAKNGVPTDGQTMAKYDAAVQAEAKFKTLNEAPTAETLTAQELKVTNLRAARNDAQTELSTARSEYRASIKSAADAYADKYESAVATDGPNSEAATKARDEMRMAQAYAGSKLAEEGVTTASERRADVVGAHDRVDKATQRLNSSADYRDALHNVEFYAGVNAINTAVGNMLQGMTQSISSMISAEATRKGAEQEQEKEQLEQTKDLFQQAQSLVDAVIQLMQAVAAAESQSMRDAIQAYAWIASRVLSPGSEVRRRLPMANLIVANEIPGASVYGVAQMSYTVNGEAGNDYAAALTAAAFREATAIEVAASSYMTVVRQRQTKVSKLGNVLATIATAMASLKTKNAEPGDHSATSWQMDVAFAAAKTICDNYGITLNVQEKEVDGVLRFYMTRGDLMRSQDDIQYKLDVEDNNLQQDMVSLQSFVSKRDSAFSTASKIISKAHNAAGSAIDNM